MNGFTKDFPNMLIAGKSMLNSRFEMKGFNYNIRKK